MLFGAGANAEAVATRSNSPRTLVDVPLELLAISSREEGDGWQPAFISRQKLATVASELRSSIGDTTESTGRIIISPGSLRLVSSNQASKKKSSTTALMQLPLQKDEDIIRSMWEGYVSEIDLEKAFEDARRYRDWLSDSENPESKEEQSSSKRGVITGWSAKSRARLVRKIAELDYTPLFTGDRRPVMLTLTLPGDYRTSTPDGQTFKRQLGNFRKRWERRWEVPLLGVWKLEFQRRGAPHVHIFGSVPAPSSAHTLRDFESWIRHAWADVVGHPDPGEKSKHERSGVDISYTSAEKGNTARRAAVYFAKYGSYSKKEHQNTVPEGWENVGRFWGVWGLEAVREEVTVSGDFITKASRILRRLGRRRIAYRKPSGRRTHRRGSSYGAYCSFKGTGSDARFKPVFPLGGTLLSDDPIALVRKLEHHYLRNIPPRPSTAGMKRIRNSRRLPDWVPPSCKEHLLRTVNRSILDGYSQLLEIWKVLFLPT